MAGQEFENYPQRFDFGAGAIYWLERNDPFPPAKPIRPAVRRWLHSRNLRNARGRKPQEVTMIRGYPYLSAVVGIYGFFNLLLILGVRLPW